METYTGLKSILAEYSNRMRADCYGTCATASATAEKVVILNCSHVTLTAGFTMRVKFTYENTASSPTVTLQTSDGTTVSSGVYIREYGTTAVGSGAWLAGEFVTLIYDGTEWFVDNAKDSTLSSSRTNALQNKVITANINGTLNSQGSSYFDTEANAIYFILDYTNTTSGSSIYLMSKNASPVSSGTVYFFNPSSSSKTLAAGTYTVYCNGESQRTITLSSSVTIAARTRYSMTATAITSAGTVTHPYAFTAAQSGFKLMPGSVVKITFTHACYAYANSTSTSYTPTLNVNGTGAKKIYSAKNGKISAIAPKKVNGVLMYWQPYTTLELIYTGSYWLIMGNPVLISYNSEAISYAVYADGKIEQWIRQSCSWTSGATITYPITYSYVPAVLGSDSDTSTSSYSGTVKIYNKTTSSFKISDNHSSEIRNAEVAFYCVGY
ncbi:hypothetical protein [Treponema sp.]|uniref:hypothetical protein n=1 Tax=Treponema sp. TaxID=166 RepID=UPI0025D63458|nr:hypothetical protein [Treponema sp.]MCR5219190.1 hypothetical protein [Treponema sp.]